MLSVLRRPSFALLWTGHLVSVAGNWVLHAALPYFVYEVTGSTVATAAMIAATLLPHVLLGSIAGVFVDRWPRKIVLLIANALQALAVLSLILVVDASSVWIVFVVAAVQSTIAAFAGPAESALLPTLVPDSEIPAANALNVFNDRLGRLVGLPLGGMLLGTFGLPAVVIFDAVSFLIALGLISFIVVPTPASRARTSAPDGDGHSAWHTFWHDWLGGLLLIRDDRRIAMLFIVFGTGTLGGTMLDPLLPAWTRDVLGAGPQTYALLMTTHAVMGVAGTLLIGRFGLRAGPKDLIGLTSVIAGASLLVKFNLPLLPVAFGSSVVTGATSSISMVGVNTLAMREVKEEFRGRVFGSMNATLALLSLTGAGIGGALGELIGPTAMLNIAATLVAISGIVAYRAYADRPAIEVAKTASS